MLKPFMHEQLIFPNQSFADKNELFQHIREEASKNQFVTDNFDTKLAERESNFPTGLEVGEINVAIPHTDPEFVKQQFIAVYTLDNPLNFNRMDDPSQVTPVSVIFVLGLNEPHAQLEVLQDLMAKLQDQNFIKGIKDSHNIEQIIEKF